MSKKRKKAERSEAGPQPIYCHAFVRSKSARSLLNPDSPPTAKTVRRFLPSKSEIRAAVKDLQKHGFKILAVNEATISIAASQEVLQRTLGVAVKIDQTSPTGGLVQKKAPALREGALDFLNADGTALEKTIEGIAVNRPVQLLCSPLPPGVGYWHVDVPDGIATLVNAARLHRRGVTGRGVRVAIVDTGCYQHPYFAARGYQFHVELAPGMTDPDVDPTGHGTGIVSAFLAVAPNADCHVIKMNMADCVGSFWKAIATGPDIISCSWGTRGVSAFPLTPEENALAAAIAFAVANGIIVVFAAGNGCLIFPGQHPDVIAVGGANLTQTGQWIASNYASGFDSPLFPGRHVPDVCGVMGCLPFGIYIMMPVPPGSYTDTTAASGFPFPNGDETQKNDGWAVFSGTSAATPQVSGVCALVKQRKPQMTQFPMRRRLQHTAMDIVSGNCNPQSGGFPATPGPDLATGYGLVDAYAAATH